MTMVLAFPISSWAEPSGREIIDRATHLDGGRSMQMRTKMEVIEGGKVTRSRSMDFRRKTAEGSDRARIDFLSPADVKGMALIIIDQPGKDADQYLYTPALRRVRRIRGSLKSQEFADSDFSYEDMERTDIDEADHTLVGQEPQEGNVCFKIESKRKKGARSQYARYVSWIDAQTYVLRKMEMYGTDGQLLKVLRSLKAEKVLDVWTQMKLEMENVSKKRKTLLETESVQYDVALDEQTFSTASLGQ